MRASRLFACIAAAGLANPTSVQALDWRVRVVNDTSRTIVGFYGVNVDESGWGANRLGADVLPAGGSIVIDFDDGGGYCRFRFRAVFDDAVELVRPSVNVCEVGTYRYTD